jgi:hypothetical protein
MNVIFHMIDDVGEPVQLVALTALLCWIGGYMLAGRDDLLVWSHRLAGFSFCAYNAYGIWNFEPDDAGQFLGIEIRALIAAFLTQGVFGIVLAVWGFVVRGPTATLERWQQSARAKAARERAEKERAEKLRQEREEYERSAPERERARQAAAAHAQLQAQAQKRRSDVRAQCEYFYHLYSPEIEGRFPRYKFDDFVAKYLSDSQSLDEVDAHAENLRKLLNAHMEKLNPRPRFTTIGELTDWYADQKAEVDEMADGPLKSSLIAMLHARYAELTTHLLEELSP